MRMTLNDTDSLFWCEIDFSSCLAFSTAMLIKDWMWFIIWNIEAGLLLPAPSSSFFTGLLTCSGKTKLRNGKRGEEAAHCSPPPSCLRRPRRRSPCRHPSPPPAHQCPSQICDCIRTMRDMSERVQVESIGEKKISSKPNACSILHLYVSFHLRLSSGTSDWAWWLRLSTLPSSLMEPLPSSSFSLSSSLSAEFFCSLERRGLFIPAEFRCRGGRGYEG